MFAASVTICWRIDSTTTGNARVLRQISSMLKRVDRCTLELFLAPCLFVSFVVPGCYPAVIGALSVPNDTSMTTALLTPTNERGVGGVGATRDRASSSRAWGSPLPSLVRRIHVERMRSRSTRRSLRVATFDSTSSDHRPIVRIGRLKGEKERERGIDRRGILRDWRADKRRVNAVK